MNNTNQTLHLIFSSPHSPTAKLSFLVMKETDTALFLGDGVFYASTIAQAKFQCYFLESDLEVRGLDVPVDQRIGYVAFVALCEKFNKVISWPK
jgi:sulfur relay protein TusB/DsrH